ncbi:MAG TPA: prolyl oligopeptidase family serine peptidase [Actinomycetota bacterium]|nr:prolyl oligopeptidase family serine peptidase [Actinomycetota bacterium]
MTTVAPYGTWASPITAGMLATTAIGLGEASVVDGIAYWLEMRPTQGGRFVVVKGDPHSDPVDVTPEGFDARTMVHEYGGGSYTVYNGTVFFSNMPDARLYRQDPGADPVAITPETNATQRFADGAITRDGRWWIGVRERHDLGPGMLDVVNELIAVPSDGSAEPRTIAGGHDFYASPRISPDGAWLAWLTWDLPWMPWDGCELFVAPLSESAELGESNLVAGRPGEESIWDPEWSPGGDLVFASDRSGWWNLERVRAGERQVLFPAEAEFGYAQWAMGEHSIAFLDDGRIACMYDSGGRTFVAILDPETGELTDLDLPFDALRWGPDIRAEGSTIVFTAGSATESSRVVWLDFAARSVDVLQVATSVPVAAEMLSVPEAIEFSTDGGTTAHAHHYRPTNPDFTAPEGERPPLMVLSHGGPTSSATPLLDLSIQYFTSRGFGVVDVNYGGSTGYGRAYRQRLNGMWGVTDLHDCINAARYLVEQGEADGDRLLIRGGSAGGYTTMCALTFTDVFAAGTSFYGISDLVPFATDDTHKFECRYEYTLIGPWPAFEETYRARSPINHTDQLSTPMLVLQGTEDHVVPPSQAELIVGVLRAKGIPHVYLLYEGEGHGFRKAETIISAREAELSFYAQILGFEPAGELPRLSIESAT